MIVPSCIRYGAISETELTEWLHAHDTAIMWRDLPGTLNAAYSLPRQTVYIARNLPAAHVPAVLAHETFHVAAAHDGHQTARVENRIDEAVAEVLIDPAAYTYWETQYGWSTGGIAAALEQPRWLVSAYRRLLERARPRARVRTHV